MTPDDRSSWPRRVVKGRHLVVGSLVLSALIAAFFAQGITVRFAPEELVAPDEAARADADRVREHFGDDGEAVVLLVEADDVLATAPLSYMHRAALALEREPAVLRVLSPTTVALPRRHMRALPEGETLDALEESDDGLGAPEVLDPVLASLADIVVAHPGRWPLGMMSLADEGTSIVLDRLVAGDVPSDAEREAVIDAWRRVPLVRGRLVSQSRRVAVIAALVRSGASEAELSDLLDAARSLAAEAPPPLTAHLTGLPAIRAEMIEALRADQLMLVTLAALASLLVLVLGLRSVAGVLLPFGTVGITVALTLGGMALFGEPINLLTNMIPPLLLTIGLAEAVHMVLRWEEEIARGLDRTEAAVATLRQMWLPCFVTTFTTAIGFGALLLQETAVLRRFGAVAAIASMVAYLVTVTFVPAMLPTMRPRARRDTAEVPEDLLERLIVKIARLASAQWRTTLGVSLLLAIVAGLVAQDIVVDSRLLDQFAEGSEVARTTRLLETELDGVRSLDVEVAGPPGHFLTPAGLDDLDALATHLREQTGVLRVESEVDWLREMRATLLSSGEPSEGDEARDAHFASEAEVRAFYQLSAAAPGLASPLSRFVTPDGNAARLEVRLADRGASRILHMLDGLDAVARGRSLSVAFSGEAYDASRGLDRIVRSLGSLGAAVALIFLVMTMLFRSVRLGLLSIPPNALPLALTLAYMVLRGIPLHAATVIVFTVTVGLSVDGATHVIARFQEEASSGLPTHEVILRTVRSSGRGVVLSSATLLLGYGALLFSAFEPVRLFGELSAVAIGGALIAQIVLLPALLAAFAMPAKVASAGERESLEPSA